MFFCRAGLIDHVVQFEQSRFDRLTAYLATSHTLAARPAPPHLCLDILTQAGAAIPFYYVRRRNISDDPVDTTIAWDRRFDICDQVDQFFGRVRREFTALPVFVQLC